MKRKRPATIGKPDFSPQGLYIGGRWVDSIKGKSFVTSNPANGEVLGDVPYADHHDIDAAVQAARAAAPDWSRVPTRERARCLELVAEAISRDAEQLAVLDTFDSGNVIRSMRADVQWTIDSIKYFASLIPELKGETFSQYPGHINLTRRQPYGVVARINPFNHPFRFCAEKAAPAMAAGNCVVVKASEWAPLSALRLGELCNGVLPPGVINIITGDAVTGAALVDHPEVHRIGFIGSVESGKAVSRRAAEQLKHVTLELGGKNPLIIFPDADPAQAANLAIAGMNLNRQGQSCSSTSRVLIHSSLHAAVRDEIVQRAEQSRVGLPWSEEAQVGAIISQGRFDDVMRFIESGRDDGAELLTGGSRPNEPELCDGFFIKPTVFDSVTAEMRIAREEIFGPVIALMVWDEFEEMMRIANGVSYGLTAGIVTNDLSRAMETAERIEAGYVWINSVGRYLGAPYGGWKSSGLGHEECFAELLSYTQIKNINMRWDPAKA